MIETPELIPGVKPYYHDAEYGQAIYNADCRELLPLIPDGAVDLVLTDPPYGISYQPTHRRWNGTASQWRPIVGDDRSFDPRFLMPMAPRHILWGGTHFSGVLPVGDWLVWDKRCSEKNDAMLGQPMEMAWTEGTGRIFVKRLLHGGVINADSVGCNNARRHHPTQKPVALMQWCMALPGVPSGAILDPFLGSGSTMVAAKLCHRHAIGIEIEERYCEIGAKRLAQGVFKFEEPTNA